MGWLIGESRGPAWKQGWTRQTIASTQPPPTPLLAILSIVVLFLAFSTYMDYKSQVNQTVQNFHLYLVLLVILSIIVVVSLSFKTSFVFRLQPDESVRRSGSASPWGVALLVVLLLFMAVVVGFLVSCERRNNVNAEAMLLSTLPSAPQTGRGRWMFRFTKLYFHNSMNIFFEKLKLKLEWNNSWKDMKQQTSLTIYDKTPAAQNLLCLDSIMSALLEDLKLGVSPVPFSWSVSCNSSEPLIRTSSKQQFSNKYQKLHATYFRFTTSSRERLRPRFLIMEDTQLGKQFTVTVAHVLRHNGD
ncbi:hypothetical protein RJ641_032466 [Dillenia turbinata]|uniref:Uncharacterized protein n=1 Tax=Dillenia turbinata TaxID=194707 RepID=A0AAN8ZLU9_9MAGN